MDRRGRWAWLIISVLWIVSCIVVLSTRAPARDADADRRDDHQGSQGSQGSKRSQRNTNTLVLVMPSPPMVSGPLTRIDRLRAIQETWGRDLVNAGDNRYCNS